MVIIVTVENQGRANAYAYENWDKEGGWNTFTIPLWSKTGELAAFCCSIFLPSGTQVADYMHVYETLQEGIEGMGLFETVTEVNK